MIENYRKILLVEDNPGDARIFEEMLTETNGCDFEIECASRISPALERLEQGGVSIVLLDLSLPDAQGFDTFMKVQEKAGGVPIIVLTGFSDEEMAIKAVKNGAQDYLVKGQVDTNTLVRSIRYAIERSRLIMELEQAKQEEHFLARHDSLTNLPNRRQFVDHLLRAIARAKRNSKKMAVLFMDLDGFKNVNDTQGHQVGDELLQLVARRLRGCVRESDTVSRFGGDEFVVLLPEIADNMGATIVAEKLIDSLAVPFRINDQDFKVTASVGISLFPLDGTHTETLISKADDAMYRVKKKGKNGIEYFNLALHSSASRRLAMEKDLNRAICNEEFLLYFQPLWTVDSREMIGAEVLLRWWHPVQGMVFPGKFIPLAEETGMIAPLGQWVLQKSCAQIKSWLTQGLDMPRIAVNLSPYQFRDKRFISSVERTVQETHLDPEHLGFEITESGVSEETNQTIKTLERLKEMGFELSMDDFGTGYSSLNNLKKFPLDKLKIDRSFVNGIPHEKKDNDITATIVAIAHNLGLKAVAEGVENDDQVSFLRDLDCDECQGFRFSRALPAAQFSRLLQA